MFSSPINDLCLPSQAIPSNDDTWESSHSLESPLSKSNSVQPCICRHAVAQGALVYGISTHSLDDDGDEDNNNNDRWTWKESVLPHIVTAISSNDDGTIIAVATDSGTVSLLRGSDGKILATRKVSQEEDMSLSANLSWVAGDGGASCGGASNSEGSRAKRLDSLLIESPSTFGESKLIMVSHICGQSLNDDSTATSAAKAMRFHPNIALLSSSGEESKQEEDIPDICSVVGLYLDAAGDTVRFVTCNRDGKLAAFDYNLESKISTLVKSGISLLEDEQTGEEKNKEWDIDYDVGLRVQTLSDRCFVLFASSSGTESAVDWFDPTSLRPVCRFQIPRITSRPKRHRSKVTAIEAVANQSDEDDSLAVVLAVKSPSDKPSVTIYVVQVLVEETFGLSILTRPHVVFTVPTDPSVISVALAALSSGDSTPFSFRFQLWRGSDEYSLKEFRPISEGSRAVGQVRLLLEQGNFDAADEVMATVGVDTLINDSFARFHPSEATLKRFKRVLEQGSICSEQAMASLRQLATGAASGSEIGITSLITAIDNVVESPSNPTVGETTTALTSILSMLGEVVKSLSSEKATKLRSKMIKLEGRLATLKLLVSGLKIDTNDLQLTGPLRGVQSPAQLYAVLISEGYFTIAEQLWRSDLRPDVKTELLVSSIMKVPMKVPPQEYIGLLEEVVLPSLSINHEMLQPLKAWVCRIVDSLDGDSNRDRFDLDAAIRLLETVDKGTRKLQVKIHSSFATYNPFVERMEIRRPKRSPRNNSANASNFSASGDANDLITPSAFVKGGQISSPSKENFDDDRPIPTVLELGRLKGGATKLKLSAFANNSDRDQTYEDNEGCVEEKLKQALCIRSARIHGLNRKVVTLQTFSHQGGALFVAKELVLFFSRSAQNHDSRLEDFSKKVKPFCQSFGVDYDKALLECTVALCRGKDVPVQAIEESSSIARCCSSVIIKCHATLAVLRAALLRGFSPPWLNKLSQDAISWASCDSALQSELEEASRLLLIDGIVLKYCGSGARELFRVDNPRHAVRLLDFVTRHIRYESVLSDALSLCDAFTHLTPRDACCSILRHAISRNECDFCVSMLVQLFQQNTVLAENVLCGSVAYIEMVLQECSQEIELTQILERANYYKRLALSASSTACAIVAAALENFRGITSHAAGEIECFLRGGSPLETLREDFSRIHRLQNQHSIFLSLSELHSSRIVLEKASQLLVPVIETYSEREIDQFSTKVTVAKRACSLLSGDSKEFTADLWAASCGKAARVLVTKMRDEDILEFLNYVGLRGGVQTEISTRANLSVAIPLFSLSMNETHRSSSLGCMKCMMRAASILRDQSLPFCPNNLLPTVSSLGNLADAVGHLFTRADEGQGELLEQFRKTLQAEVWRQRVAVGSRECEVSPFSLPLHRPNLHPSWYVGDGLLLPPEDVLSRSIYFCRDMMGRGLGNGTTELRQLVGDRGAYFLALRVLCLAAVNLSVSVRLSACEAQNAYVDTANGISDAIQSLSARSLGGNSTGKTSGLVDSQLAVAFLLSLPVKLAFKAYRSSIPTAMQTRDFDRVFTLANVGYVAGSDGAKDLINGFFSVGWSKQQKFVDQCLRLATRSMWWKILRLHGVDFDPQRFSYKELPVSKKSIVVDGEILDGGESWYAASLLLSFIAGISKRFDRHKLLYLCSLFAKTFDIPKNLVIQRHIEFLLSPPTEASPEDNDDIRFDLNLCQKEAKSSLRLLQTPKKQLAVLRRCIVLLEESVQAGFDYERHSMVLCLYHEALIYHLDHCLSNDNTDCGPFEAEVELIDRRRDALAILSSFFVGDRVSERPRFSSFFVPLKDHTDNGSDKSEQHRTCGILGNDAKSESSYFDPLKPLEKLLSTSHDMVVATALAPLCLPLGLPQGYIHARSLMARFRSSSAHGTVLPSFENDALPVFNRIRSTRDKAIFAEWCASQYINSDEQKLKCLNLSLEYAVQSSTEIERCRQRVPQKSDKNLAEMEQNALDAVKRVTSAKEALHDRLRVKAILRSVDATNLSFSEDLIENLQTQACKDPEMSPESLVDFLLSTGSLLAARSCINNEKALSMKYLRIQSSIVHEACRAISEQHSHIRTDKLAWRLARKWLFYGDDLTPATDENAPIAANTPSSRLLNFNIPEEDTIDFVMDLADIQKVGEEWGSGVQQKHGETAARFTSDEEPSALKEISQREVSEASSQRASLRIAFVMAFYEHPNADSIRTNSPTGAENANITPNQVSSDMKKRTGLLAQIESKLDNSQDNKVVEYSRELLRIVFAGNSGTSSNLMARTNTSYLEDSVEAPKTVTFSMRHRALRVASILCPQEALEQVIRDEGFLRVAGSGSSNCTLKQCSFGVFVAKEIEEMGLPLPHSDLRQLSSMHFLSYARTLWRDQRDIVGSKGRFFLLLLEMSVKNVTTDLDFVDSLLTEITKMQLPRTLLLALERIVSFHVRSELNNASRGRAEISSELPALKAVTKIIISELRRIADSGAFEVDCLGTHVQTVERLKAVIELFSDCHEGQQLLDSFAQDLSDITAAAEHESLSEGLSWLRTSALRRVELVSQNSTSITFIGDVESLSTALHQCESKLKCHS